MKSISFLAAAGPIAALAQLFPPPTGPYQVTWENAELVDENRQDPWEPSQLRRMMISHFKPVDEEQCVKKCRVPYMSTQLADIEDDILVEYLAEVGWPGGVLQTLELEVCCETTKMKPKEKVPTILFGAGLNTTRLFYSSTAQHLASLGYEVIVMDHPYDTDAVEFPNGDVVFGGRINKTDGASLAFGLEVRAADASFVLDHFNLCETVYMGQSFGGASSIDSLNREPRIRGGVNLDGALFGPVPDTGVDSPNLFFGSTGHNSSDTVFEPSWHNFFEKMDTEHADVWARELHVENSVHNTYCDFSVIGDISGLRDNADLVEVFFGPVRGDKMMEILKAYLGAFVEFILNDADEGLLAGESDEWPEVAFFR